MAIVRRRRLADAAIDTLATAGMRGLTHRSVDRAAGLPEGSCSYYFRTRHALLRRSVEAMLAELGVSDPPRQAPLIIAYLDGLVFDQIAGVAARILTRHELRVALLAMLRSFASS